MPDPQLEQIKAGVAEALSDMDRLFDRAEALIEASRALRESTGEPRR